MGDVKSYCPLCCCARKALKINDFSASNCPHMTCAAACFPFSGGGGQCGHIQSNISPGWSLGQRACRRQRIVLSLRCRSDCFSEACPAAALPSETTGSRGRWKSSERIRRQDRCSCRCQSYNRRRGSVRPLSFVAPASCGVASRSGCAQWLESDSFSFLLSWSVLPLSPNGVPARESHPGVSLHWCASVMASLPLRRIISFGRSCCFQGAFCCCVFIVAKNHCLSRMSRK